MPFGVLNSMVGHDFFFLPKNNEQKGKRKDNNTNVVQKKNIQSSIAATGRNNPKRVILDWRIQN